MPKASTLQELNDILVSRVNVYNNTHKHPEYKDKTIDEVYVSSASYTDPSYCQMLCMKKIRQHIFSHLSYRY
jgi:hypothetical protein